MGIVAREEIARITLFKLSRNKFRLIVNFIIASQEFFILIIIFINSSCSRAC